MFTNSLSAGSRQRGAEDRIEGSIHKGRQHNGNAGKAHSKYDRWKDEKPQRRSLEREEVLVDGIEGDQQSDKSNSSHRFHKSNNGIRITQVHPSCAFLDSSKEERLFGGNK